MLIIYCKKQTYKEYFAFPYNSAQKVLEEFELSMLWRVKSMRTKGDGPVWSLRILVKGGEHQCWKVA